MLESGNERSRDLEVLEAKKLKLRQLLIDRRILAGVELIKAKVEGAALTKAQNDIETEYAMARESLDVITSGEVEVEFLGEKLASESFLKVSFGKTRETPVNQEDLENRSAVKESTSGVLEAKKLKLRQLLIDRRILAGVELIKAKVEGAALTKAQKDIETEYAEARETLEAITSEQVKIIFREETLVPESSLQLEFGNSAKEAVTETITAKKPLSWQEVVLEKAREMKREFRAAAIRSEELGLTTPPAIVTLFDELGKTSDHEPLLKHMADIIELREKWEKLGLDLERASEKHAAGKLALTSV